MNRLIQMFRANARTPRRFEAQADADAVTIYLYDIIVPDEETADWWGGVDPLSFAQAVSAAKGKPIRLRINSPGGDVFAARAMAQHLAEHDKPVHVIVDGYAASAATVVAIQGTTLNMAPGAMFMIHKSWSIGVGNSDDLLQMAALLEKVDQTLADSYQKKLARAGKDTSAAAIMQMMQDETWFTADEAVAAGFADTVSSEQTSAQASWDMSAYGKAPHAPADEQQSANDTDADVQRIAVLKRALALRQRAA